MNLSTSAVPRPECLVRDDVHVEPSPVSALAAVDFALPRIAREGTRNKRDFTTNCRSFLALRPFARASVLFSRQTAPPALSSYPLRAY